MKRQRIFLRHLARPAMRAIHDYLARSHACSRVPLTGVHERTLSADLEPSAFAAAERI